MNFFHLKAQLNFREISTNKLSIEPGAIFSGNCKMGAVLKDITSSEESREEAKEVIKEKTA